MNELVTKTLRRVTIWKERRGVISQASRSPPNEQRKGHTRDETRPRNEGDDGPFAAGRKTGVYKIVIGLSCCFWSQQGTLLCCHGVQGNSEVCNFRREGRTIKTGGKWGKIWELLEIFC